MATSSASYSASALHAAERGSKVAAALEQRAQRGREPVGSAGDSPTWPTSACVESIASSSDEPERGTPMMSSPRRALAQLAHRRRRAPPARPRAAARVVADDSASTAPRTHAPASRSIASVSAGSACWGKPAASDGPPAPSALLARSSYRADGARAAAAAASVRTPASYAAPGGGRALAARARAGRARAARATRARRARAVGRGDRARLVGVRRERVRARVVPPRAGGVADRVVQLAEHEVRLHATVARAVGRRAQRADVGALADASGARSAPPPARGSGAPSSAALARSIENPISRVVPSSAASAASSADQRLVLAPRRALILVERRDDRRDRAERARGDGSRGHGRVASRAEKAAALGV